MEMIVPLPRHTPGLPQASAVNPPPVTVPIETPGPAGPRRDLLRAECIYGHVPQYKNVPVPCESRSSILLWVMETPSFSMWKERLSQRSRGVEADACTAPLTRAVEEEQDDNHDCEKELEYIYESVGPDAAPRVAERSNAGAPVIISPFVW